MRPLLLVALWIGLVALACGCQTVRCYDAVTLNPAAGFGVVFNGCTGDFERRPFALPKPPTTTTTIPTPNAEHDYDPYDHSEKRDI